MVEWLREIELLSLEYRRPEGRAYSSSQLPERSLWRGRGRSLLPHEQQ